MECAQRVLHASDSCISQFCTNLLVDKRQNIDLSLEAAALKNFHRVGTKLSKTLPSLSPSLPPNSRRKKERKEIKVASMKHKKKLRVLHVSGTLNALQVRFLRAVKYTSDAGDKETAIKRRIKSAREERAERTE